MAQRYVTQEEYQSQMLGAPSETERDFGLGGEGDSPASPLETTQEAPQASAPTGAAPEDSSPNLRGYSSIQTSGGPFSGLFSPVKNTLAEAQKGLATEQTNFDAAAGPRRDFSSIGGQGTLDTAFQESASPDQVSQARGLASAQYSGPLGFDQASVENLRESLYGAKEAAKAGQRTSGAAYFAGQATPGMTSGEKRQEGGRRANDPGYQAQVRDLQFQAGQGLSGLEGAEKAASAFATGRKQDEAGIAKAAQEIAKGRQSAALGAIDTRVASRDSDDAALQDAYDRFVGSGSLQDLVALPGTQGEVIDEAQLYRDATGAQGVWDSVMGKYSQIADIPLLEPQVSSHGKAVLGFPEDWWRTEGVKYPPAEIAKIREMAMARQAELENTGFANEQRAAIGGKGVLKSDAGRYSAFNPLYGDLEGVKPEDLRSYFGLQMGNEATRANTATEGERFTANRAADILGQLETIDESTTPYEASKIVGEGEIYLADLEKAVKGKEFELGERRDEVLAAVKKARKDYLKAKKAKNVKVAARIIGGIGSLGLSEITIGDKRPAEEVGGAGMLGLMNALGAKQNGV